VTEHPLALPAVWSCVSLIADTVSLLPLRLYTDKNGVGEPQPNHPVSRLLKRPNEISNAHTFRHSMALSLAAFGNAYAYIDRDGSGSPRGLYFVPHYAVSATELTDGQLEYHVRVDASRVLKLRSRDMLHVIRASLDGKRGVSPITMHRHLYDHDFSQFDYGSAFYERGRGSRDF
jgi:HK97 family phage portal protein